MNRKTVLAVLIACVMALALCVGCAPRTQGAQNADQAANRAYMSQVNQTMSTLNEKLDAFVDAVSREDSVGVKTQVDRAIAVLGELESMEAPEALADVHDAYKKGCESLKTALKSYSDLYASGATVSAESLAPIQASYDEGVAALQEADKLASEKA